jgi:hypothetical protein
LPAVLVFWKVNRPLVLAMESGFEELLTMPTPVIVRNPFVRSKA